MNDLATALASALAFSGVSALAETENTCDCCWVATDTLLAN